MSRIQSLAIDAAQTLLCCSLRRRKQQKRRAERTTSSSSSCRHVRTTSSIASAPRARSAGMCAGRGLARIAIGARRNGAPPCTVAAQPGYPQTAPRTAAPAAAAQQPHARLRAAMWLHWQEGKCGCRAARERHRPALALLRPAPATRLAALRAAAARQLPSSARVPLQEPHPPLCRAWPARRRPGARGGE